MKNLQYPDQLICIFPSLQELKKMQDEMLPPSHRTSLSVEQINVDMTDLSMDKTTLKYFSQGIPSLETSEVSSFKKFLL